MIAEDVLMTVPALLVRCAAGVDLDESHTALDKATCPETLPCERGANPIVQTVQALDGSGFAAQIECLRGGALHAVGQLEALDPGIQVDLIRAGGAVLPVECCQQIELAALLGLREESRPRGVENRFALGPQVRALKGTG